MPPTNQPARHTDNSTTITVPRSRFAEHLPAQLAPGEDNRNPADFPLRNLSNLTAPTGDDQHPLLLDPTDEPTVIPLDYDTATRIVTERAHKWDGHDADEKPFDPTPHPIVIRDSVRKYAFDGIRLAYVSSEQPDKPRWTEITIYRHTGGIYIAHRVAVTTVAHTPECEILVRYHKKYTTGLDALAHDEFGVADRTACTKCEPDIAALLRDNPLDLCCERDRHQVTISDYPESLIQSLHTVKNGDRTLGPLAASALQLASDRDTSLAMLFYGTAIIDN